jgi:hypothetical protein
MVPTGCQVTSKDSLTSSLCRFIGAGPGQEDAPDLGFELDAVRAVIDPGPACLHELAGRDHRGMANDGDQIALATGFDPWHAEAVVGVMEGNAVDQARQGLRRARRQGPCHPKAQYAVSVG